MRRYRTGLEECISSGLPHLSAMAYPIDYMWLAVELRHIAKTFFDAQKFGILSKPPFHLEQPETVAQSWVGN